MKRSSWVDWMIWPFPTLSATAWFGIGLVVGVVVSGILVAFGFVVLRCGA